MLPGYLDDAVMGFVLVPGTPTSTQVVDADRTAARLLGLDRSELVGSHWTDPSADGDSPVVVRARVGPAARHHVELTITRQPDGTNAGLGMGLNVAQAILIAHGGSLDVTSTPGDGAQFSLRLQAAPSVAVVASDQEAS
jgi:hypothetical protein